ncbi:DUF3592 domain-containing protein [Polymorphobacter megasporae]|uniref:DUF3592 domain-containing protein n=1 Tax=Glacieibacterium megasporae TaxID=2835787 RepID=UPI001C1E8670|nr:DUF3592 domain-containing protein [Polymorphobacter megasporae]UAJ08645.1 DUF3592 domain-containing protein [Polymorphobacter megasporae]
MADGEPRRIGAILFVGIGVAALAVGLWQGVQTERFVGRAVAATGHVVAVPGQESPTMSGAHPMVEFTAADGSIVRYRQDGMGARTIGTPVDLLYDPAAPADTAVVGGFWTLWFPVAGPIVLGLAFILVPLLGIPIGLRGAR